MLLANHKKGLTMEQYRCKVCGKIYNADNKLQPIFDHCTEVKYGLCEKDQRLFNEGYVALVACKTNNGKTVSHKDVCCTGYVVHIKRDLAKRLFADSVNDNSEMFYCSDELMEQMIWLSKQQGKKR